MAGVTCKEIWRSSLTQHHPLQGQERPQHHLACVGLQADMGTKERCQAAEVDEDKVP